MTEPPYKLSRVYSDNFVYATVTSYAARVDTGVKHIEYCHPEYDAATGRYFADLARHFPGDMIVRGARRRCGSWSCRFRGIVPAWDFDGQRPDPAGGNRCGLAIVAAAVVLATLGSVRIGLFLVFFLLYFGGYPAVQFHARHYFHLEFITWWAAGFVVHTAARRVYPTVREQLTNRQLGRSVRNAVLALGGCAALLLAALWSARVYPQAAAQSIFESYLAAPKDEVSLSEARGAPHPVPRMATMPTRRQPTSCKSTPTDGCAATHPPSHFATTRRFAGSSRGGLPSRATTASTHRLAFSHPSTTIFSALNCPMRRWDASRCTESENLRRSD